MSKISLIYSCLVLISCSLLPRDYGGNLVFEGDGFTLQLKNNGEFLISENIVFGDSWNGMTALQNDSIVLTLCKKYLCDDLIISLNQGSFPSKNSEVENQYNLLIKGSMQFERWFYILQISADSIRYHTVASGYGDSDLKSIIYSIDRDKFADNVFFKFHITELESNDCIKAAIFNSFAIDIANLNNGLSLDLAGDFDDFEVCDKIFAQFIDNRRAIVIDSNCAIEKNIILYRVNNSLRGRINVNEGY